MSAPTILIVGAPRCGTTSLSAYLSSHPRVFMSNPKEPHHFGADLPLPADRPYKDLDKYLRLFDAAGDRQAGEASVFSLYSRTAPGEILAVSPQARIIIMLRDPVDMVCSLHAHCLLGGYEDLPDLEQAHAAEEDRRHGLRMPRLCPFPLTLQYTFIGRYAEHVRRYLEIFGPERVKCVLFEDLRDQPEKTYHETLAFLGLEAAGAPDFKARNARLRWRSHRLAAFVLPVLDSVKRRNLPGRFGRPARGLLGLLFYVTMRLSLTKTHAAPPSPELKARLRERFREDVEQLAGLIGRDLSSWLRP